MVRKRNPENLELSNIAVVFFPKKSQKFIFKVVWDTSVL